MKKYLILISIVIAAALVIVGCTPAAPQPDPTQAPVEDTGSPTDDMTTEESTAPDTSAMTDDEKQILSQLIDVDAPNLAYPDFEGNIENMSDYYDDIVILNFWAVGCPPCVSEMPELNELHNMDNITVVTIAPKGVLGNNLEDSKRFIEQFDVVKMWDESLASLNDYRSNAFPHSYIIGRDGKIKFKIIGASNKAGFLRYVNFLEKYDY